MQHTMPIIMIPDDNMSGIIAGIQHAPKMCVDYLSHEWTKEDDIWTSWKVMSKQKKDIANGIRLENASWRTWAKQKYNLKTVDPKKLNWLKDSDVTWLYGPLHTALSTHVSSSKSQKTEDKLNLMPSSSTKSCLKKRKSISEILLPIVRGRYGSLVASNSDTQLYRKEERDNDLDFSDCETSSTCSSISGPTTPTAGPTKPILLPTGKDISRQNRKIQFNDRVEQCIAVDNDYNNLNDSDSSDDGIVMNFTKKDRSTICKLAPTKLKEDRIHNNEYSSLYSNNRRRSNYSSSNNNSSTASSSSSPSSSSPTPPSTTSQSWRYDDDDDDVLELDLIDFDAVTIHQQPNENQDQNQNQNHNVVHYYNEEEEDDDDDGIVGRVLNMVGRFF